MRSIIPDHATHLKAVNHPIRREMLRFVNDKTRISREDLLTLLKENDVLDKEDVFNYNMDFLIQAECVKKIEEDSNSITYEILPGGKVIENF